MNTCTSTCCGAFVCIVHYCVCLTLTYSSCWHHGEEPLACSRLSLSSCVSTCTTVGKHPGGVGNASGSRHNWCELTTYGDLENWVSGWLDWKLQVTEVSVLTTWLDLKVHRRTPVVPFSIITSGSACMSIANAGVVTIRKELRYILR